MLGKVISVLAEHSAQPAVKRKKLFVPYRDSVLTWSVVTVVYFMIL